MFRNREAAAEALADRLAPYRGRHPLILAVPRGAVPMGRVLADRLEGDLDVVLVHKLGAPGNPEYAIGSVREDGTVRLRPEAERIGIDRPWLDRAVAHELRTLRERRQRYTPGVDRAEATSDLHGRIAIVVDDGIATGATLSAAIAAVRDRNPERLVAAVAVAPPETARRLAGEVDELVVLDTPQVFYAVGEFFGDFRQVTDDEVVAALQAHAKSVANRS